MPVPLGALVLSNPMRKVQALTPSRMWNSEVRSLPRATQPVRGGAGFHMVNHGTTFLSPNKASAPISFRSLRLLGAQSLPDPPLTETQGNWDPERGKCCPKALSKQVNQVPRSLSSEANGFCRGRSKQRLPCSFYVEAPWVFFFFLFFFFHISTPPVSHQSREPAPDTRLAARHPEITSSSPSAQGV